MELPVWICTLLLTLITFFQGAQVIFSLGEIGRRVRFEKYLLETDRMLKPRPADKDQPKS